MQADVAIVGAGPAGSTSGHRALDGTSFPPFQTGSRKNRGLNY